VPVEDILSYYDYWFMIILLMIGLYGMIIKRNLVKKLIGMTIFQASIVLFYIASAVKHDATVPIYTPEIPNTEIASYINPLPHTLMLTAIVVGVAILGVAFSLLVLIYNRYKTLDEQELLEKMK
jgi:multicomponent Na+:H+ antiporter subunit C